jgi:hypothetical protein
MIMNNPKDYRDRALYRHNILKKNFILINITVKETDLFISSDIDISETAIKSVHRLRSSIESYITLHPEFASSLIPVPYDKYAPEIIREMMLVSRLAGVGPMAAVAGAIAEGVGRDIGSGVENVIIENGGDIYFNLKRDVTIGIFAGKSKLSEKISIKVRRAEMPLGVCTSSGTVGHSVSFGVADACCVKSKSTALADAAATAIGNLVQSKKDIRKALEAGMKIDGVLGILIIIDDQLGSIGNLELAS